MAATFPKPGPPGPEEAPFVFVQAAPSSDFVVAHGLNRELVNAKAYDSTGAEVLVGTQVIDANNIRVTTVAELPFSGKVLVL